MGSKTVYRCEYCDGTVIDTDIRAGGCPTCQGRKVKIAFSVSEAEMEDLKSRGFEVDPSQWSDKPWSLDAA